MLTKEQILQYRAKYNIGGAGKTDEFIPSGPKENETLGERIQRYERAAEAGLETKRKTAEQKIEGIWKDIKPSDKKELMEWAGLGVEKASEIFTPHLGKVIGSVLLKATDKVGALKNIVGDEKADFIIGNLPKTKTGDIIWAALEAPGGLLSKAVGFTGKVVSHIPGVSKIGEALKRSAVKSITKVLQPTKEKFKIMTEQVAQKLVDTGFIGTKTGLLKKAEKMTSVLGPQIDEAFGKLPETAQSQIKPIMDALENLKYEDKYILKEAGKDVIVDSQAVNDINKIKEIFVQFGEEASDQNLRRVKQVFDKAVAPKGGYVKTDLTRIVDEAKREAANIIRDGLAQKYPDIAKLNKEYSFWKKVSDITEATLQRKTGQTGAMQYIAPTVVLGEGILEGKPIKAGLSAVAVKQIQKLVSSDIYRTLSAQVKNKIADVILEGKEEKILDIVGRITSAGGNITMDMLESTEEKQVQQE